MDKIYENRLAELEAKPTRSPAEQTVLDALVKLDEAVEAVDAAQVAVADAEVAAKPVVATPA